MWESASSGFHHRKGLQESQQPQHHPCKAGLAGRPEWAERKHHPVDLVPCEGLTLREVAVSLGVMGNPLQCRVEDLTAWWMAVECELVGVRLSQSRFQILTLQRGKAWG